MLSDGTFSVSLWFKLDAAVISGQARHVMFSQEGTWLYVNQGDLIVRYENDAAQYEYLRGPYDLEADRWYHMVFTFDGTTMKLYTDGAAPTTKTWTHTSSTPESAAARLGEHTGGYYDFHGQIADVRVYERAISSTDVSALHDVGLNESHHWKLAVLGNEAKGYIKFGVSFVPGAGLVVAGDDLEEGNLLAATLGVAAVIPAGKLVGAGVGKIPAVKSVKLSPTGGAGITLSADAVGGLKLLSSPGVGDDFVKTIEKLDPEKQVEILEAVSKSAKSADEAAGILAARTDEAFLAAAGRKQVAERLISKHPIDMNGAPAASSALTSLGFKRNGP